jgi:hypothetical protein
MPAGAPTCTGAYPDTGGLGQDINLSCPGRLPGSFGAEAASADFNADGFINGLDLGVLAGYFGQAYASPTDVRATADPNRDGFVNGLDLGVLAGHFGSLVPHC